MINLSCRNVSLSGHSKNSYVTFQEPLLFGNQNNESLLTKCCAASSELLLASFSSLQNDFLVCTVSEIINYKKLKQNMFDVIRL